MIARGIGFAALVMIWPCSTLGQATFFAGGNGALVCDTPKPLTNYKNVYKDAEARSRYLSSEDTSNCQLAPKNTTYEPVDPKAAYFPSTEVVRLHLKGDRKSVYALKGEWLVTTPELAEWAQAIRKCIHSKWNNWKPVPNAPPEMIVKVRLRLNPDGRFSEPPVVMNRNDDPKFQSTSDKAIQAAKACEPFKLPREKHELWKDIVLNFDPRPQQAQSK
jgi:hypothetical protein